MEIQKKLIELNIGSVYSQGKNNLSLDYVLEFKDKLENKLGIQMIFIDNQINLCIKCYNLYKNGCTFVYKFIKKKDIQSKDYGYELQQINQNHIKQCVIYNEQYRFLRNRHILIERKDLLTNLILNRYEQNGPQIPKKILQASQQIIQKDWIYKGIFNNSTLRRKIKKKFDNLVAQIRKQNDLNATQNARNIKLKRKKKTNFTDKKSQQNENQSQDNFIDSSQSQYIYRGYHKGEIKKRQKNKKSQKETLKGQSFETQQFQQPKHQCYEIRFKQKMKNQIKQMQN